MCFNKNFNNHFRWVKKYIVLILLAKIFITNVSFWYFFIKSWIILIENKKLNVNCYHTNSIILIKFCAKDAYVMLTLGPHHSSWNWVHNILIGEKNKTINLPHIHILLAKLFITNVSF